MIMLASRRSLKSVWPSVCCGCKRMSSSTETTPESSTFIGMVKKHRRLQNDRKALLDYLINNVIYENDEIIAINKPMEFPLFYHPPKSYTGDPIALEDQPPNLAAMLPYLAEHFKAPYLDVSMPLQRCYSGVLVLGKNKDFCKHFKHNSEGLRKKRVLFQKLDMICLGFPKLLPDKKEDVFLKFEKINGVPQSVIVKDVSNTMRRKHMVDLTCCYPEIISQYGDGKSVYDSWCHVRLRVISSAMDICQNYMASKLAPVLGDPVYHKHVSYSMGMAVKGNIKLQSSKDMPVFPEIRKRLGIKPEQDSLIPLMVHKSSIFVAKNCKHPITAPLPDYFQLALEQLSLAPELPEHDDVEPLESDSSVIVTPSV